ncbi:hypothetical protein L484_014397 [Morus notabilis]|uniref:Uncharacterized protein n=1 Tax=Morus notabilis TaxID=981085 RepID=W9RMP2_9ROSA|nr:hypothetical protein L484_014397 [Morus notabilis]
MEIVMEGLLGKLGRQCYAVLCLGVLLVSVTIARCVSDAAETEPRRRTTRSLHALQGPPLRRQF